MNIASIRAAIGKEYTAATAEIEAELHKFLDWAEGKEKAQADAVALLTAAGYTVTAPVAVPA